jgi:hypothetical protein
MPAPTIEVVAENISAIDEILFDSRNSFIYNFFS